MDYTQPLYDLAEKLGLLDEEVLGFHSIKNVKLGEKTNGAEYAKMKVSPSNRWAITNLEVWSRSTPYLKVLHSTREGPSKAIRDILDSMGADPQRTKGHERVFPHSPWEETLARLAKVLNAKPATPLASSDARQQIDVAPPKAQLTAQVVPARDWPVVDVARGQADANGIDRFVKLIPAQLLERSGAVFNTGREAFAGSTPFYLLGLNPGGDPQSHQRETVRSHTEEVLSKNSPWSAYRDNSWDGREPGSAGMQPRILHLMQRLNLQIDRVPMSNLVFERTRSEADLKARIGELTQACWPFHEAVIRDLKVRIVLCLGRTTGKLVREKLGATEFVRDWKEQNERGWSSSIYIGARRTAVITLTHPARADWTNPTSDPTGLVESLRLWVADWKRPAGQAEDSGAGALQRNAAASGQRQRT